MDIDKHLFIILASYSSNALGQIRSLGEKGIKPIVVLTHKSTFRIDKSKYILKLYDVNSFNEGLDLIIQKYKDSENKPFIYTDCDEVMGIIDKRYDELKDNFFIWNAGGPCRLAHFMEKGVQLTLAKECGMNVPKTEIVRVGCLPHSLNYPIFTKATDSYSNIWWKANSYICHNEIELKKAYSKMDIESIVLQEYIIKKDETPIEGISINGGDDIFLFGQTKNYRMSPKSYGTFRYLDEFKDNTIYSQIKKFIKKVAYTGAFEVEFIIDQNGIPYFLEVNFRISQPNYAFTAFGANIPYIYAKSILNNKIATEEIHYITKKPFNLMYEFEDFKFSILLQNISLKKWVKDLRHCDVFLYFNKKDQMPFIYTIFSKILLFFKNKIRIKFNQKQTNLL